MKGRGFTAQRAAAVVALAPFVLALSACGERPQVIQYKQGTYQGKQDTAPYNAAPFNGNRGQWENTIKQRNQAQNEYKRTG